MTHLPQPVRRRGRLVRAAVVAACALGVAVASAGSAGAATRRETPNQRADRQVSANLWEWNWPSVAKECRTQLGPNGFRGVQVAPPQDSVKRQHLGDGSGHDPAPVVGGLPGRRLPAHQPDGHRAAVQVDGADLPQGRREGVRRRGHQPHDRPGRHVLRRRSRTALPTTERAVRAERTSTSTPVTARRPAVASRTSTTSSRCSTASSSGWPTCAPTPPRCATQLAGYLNKLLRYGVSGFRVDAAKHIGQRDLDAIYSRLHDTVDGTRPYWALEVFGGGPGTLSPEAFTRSGDVLGLDGVKQLETRSRATPPTRRAASPR